MSASQDRRRFLKQAGIASAVAVSAPFVLRRAWAATPIKIGHINTFSGPLAALGEQGRWALTVAVNRINGAGGINGRKIQVIERDDAFKPAQAVREAEKLILREKVDVITGVSSSGICVQLAPLCQRYRTLFVLGTGCETTTLTGDTAKRCPKYVFRPYNSTSSQAIAMAPWALANNIKSATSIYMDMAWGQSVSKDFAKEFTKLGGRWAKGIPAPLSTTDYLPLVSRITQDADALVMGMSGGHAIKCLLAAAAAGLTKKMKILGPASLCDVNTIAQQGKSAVGGFYLHRYPAVASLKGSPFDDAPNHKFRAEFTKLSKGVLPSGFAQAQFTGMNLLKHAMQGVNYRSKAEDTDRMVAWLEGAGGSTPMGPGRLLKRGDDFPQGDIYLRASDHQGFVNFYMATVNDKLEFEIVGDIVAMKTTIYPSKFNRC